MIKKIFLFGIALVLVIASLSACGDEKVVELKDSRTPDAMTLDMRAPNPYDLFQEAEITVTDGAEGQAYQFLIKPGTQEIFDRYVQACKEGIFKNVHMESNQSYQAYTESKDFWISVTYFISDNSTENYVYVDVRDLREKTNE